MKKLNIFFIFSLLFLRGLIKILVGFGFIYMLIWLVQKGNETKTISLAFKIITSKSIIIIFIIWGIINLFKKKGPIYYLFAVAYMTIGSAIYDFYKSKNIIKTQNIKQAFFYFINPFRDINYFDLNNLEKKLLKETGNNSFSLIERINGYFGGKFKGFKITVNNFEELNNTRIFTLFRPSGLQEYNVSKLDINDIIHGIGLSINKYNLDLEVGNEIKIIISEKNSDKTYNLKDYVKALQKNTIYLGFNEVGKLLSIPVSFELANHLGVYGTTGSGKSNFTSGLLYSLYVTNPDYRFVILDPKGDFSSFRKLERIDYAHEIADILELGSKIQKNMNLINKTFFEKHVSNYKEYKELNEDNSLIKPTFIFVEEFSLLLNQIEDKEKKEEFIKMIKNVAIAGRSIAYNLVFSLQVPLIKVINDSEITRMLKVISFNIDNRLNQNIFGEKIRFNLSSLNTGVGVMSNNGNLSKFKAMLTTKDILQELSNQFVKKDIDILDEYLHFARQNNSFSLKEATEFGLTRSQFDSLSKKLQSNGDLKKLNNNSLVFSDNDLLQNDSEKEYKL